MKWIKIEDQFPPKDKRILFYCRIEMYDTDWISLAKYRLKDENVISFHYGDIKLTESHWLIGQMPWPLSDERLIECISHWSPLPEF
jgi:hypothetical protein